MNRLGLFGKCQALPGLLGLKAFATCFATLEVKALYSLPSLEGWSWHMSSEV